MTIFGSLALIFRLEKIMADVNTLKTDFAALKEAADRALQALADATAALKAAIAANDPQGIADVAAAMEAETAAINAALPPVPAP